MGLLIGTLKMRQIIKDQRLKRTQIWTRILDIGSYFSR